MHSLRVFLKLAELNLKQLLIYRLSFFISLALMTFWTAAFVILILVIFEHTDSLAGFQKGEVLLVLSFYYFFQNLADIFFKDNFEEFGEVCRRGLFDLRVVKPAPSRLLAFLYRMRFDYTAGFIVTFALFIFAIRHLAEIPQLVFFLLGFLYSFLMTFLYWCILSIISTLTFWISKNDAFRALIWNMTQIARYPRQIYQHIIGKIFTFGLPIALLAALPAEIAIRFNNENLPWYGIFLTLLFYTISKIFWEYGLKKYTSAN